MRRRSILVLLLLTALALPLAAGTARADEGDAPAAAAAKDYVGQLTKAELAFLRSRVEGWDKLESLKKQRIAHNVLRIRSLKPEQRRAFEKKLSRLRDGGRRSKSGRGRFHDHATRMLVNRALAKEAQKRLGREFEARMRRRDISQHAFEMAFSMTFWRRLAEGMEPVAPDALPPGFPKHQRERYAKEWGAYTQATEPKQRARLGKMLSFKAGMMRLEQIRRRIQQTDLRGEAYVAAVGAAVREEFADAFDRTAGDADALLAASDKVEVQRSLRRLVTRTGRLDRDESALLVALVNRWVTQNVKKDAASGSAGDETIRRLLVQELKVSPEDAAKLPAAGEVEARALYFQKLLRGSRLFPRGRGGHGPDGRAPGSDGRRRRGQDGRPLRALVPTRPEGLSDADWAVFKATLGKARADGRMPDLRTRPEGMSEAGWKLLRAAIAKRMRQRPGPGKRAR